MIKRAGSYPRRMSQDVAVTQGIFLFVLVWVAISITVPLVGEAEQPHFSLYRWHVALGASG